MSELILLVWLLACLAGVGALGAAWLDVRQVTAYAGARRRVPGQHRDRAGWWL